MQVARLVLVAIVLAAPAARGDEPASSTTSSGEAATPDDLDLRLTLSSFFYRQSGSDPAPLVDQGANPQNASPVKRFFGDLRMELSDGDFAADARIRQTTSERYQSGADGGGEYEIRTLDYRIGSRSRNLTLGRQFIDAVGATKIDGASFSQQLADTTSATLFAGAYPLLGSRSLDTDYIVLDNPDGTHTRLVPLSAGVGASYSGAEAHADVGLAGVYVPQDIPNATSDEKTRVFATTSGYWRPGIIDVYHFVLLDLAGGNGLDLTNGSVGVDARPGSNVQLSLAVNHVSTDILQIAARNFLADPDPTAIGVVQNNIALLHISQDNVRGGASLALAARRFEISVSAGVNRRPAVSVALADGSGAVSFPEARSADLTFTILDRRSIAGLRLAASGTVIEPFGSTVPNRSRGTVARVSASRLFAEQRGQVEIDLMGERFHDVGTPQPCTSSLNVFACFGTAVTTAAQAGLLASWRVGREWLLIADTHVGSQNIDSQYVAPMAMMPVHWPTVLSVTAFVRVQWRYR